ncbi:Crp/Fnr family transcriptional regulator [Tissierella sp. Yu-01]|uniref:Crp/Fnr family transcriptional regulator n=1 Tax=Tissierella sp. Yu-01 TaxID=3035694 RepID=UPI00240CF00D|nr:Crp/Fnr family transcriptional regulator [Tissierella sp. Yu-01]WFA08590.1 Crp/Fnr family transcriptional regulator [Tissierella sp. Yu-01]
MMKLENYYDVLKNIDLFGNFSDEDFKKLFKSIDYRIHRYTKDSMVFIEGRECNTLNIILRGNIRIQKIDSFGKALVVVDFKEGDIYGETLLFGKPNIYPMTGISTMDTTILYLPKEAVFYLCRNDDVFLKEFLTLLSLKSVTLSSKLNQISLKTIRQKICEFILMDYNKNESLKIKLNMTKSEWADIMGVQRPSLSRELLEMKRLGLIDYDYNYIYVKDIEGIKKILLSS